MYWHIPIYILLVCLLVTSQAGGQPQRVPLIRQSGNADIENRPFDPSMFERMVTSEAPRLQALRDPVLRMELDLAKVEPEVQQIIGQFFSTLQDVQSSVDWRQLSEEERKEIVGKLTDLSVISELEIVELLGPSKSQRVAELMNWQWMRKHGPLSLLCDSQLANDAHVTDHQREMLHRVWDDVVLDVNNECLNIERIATRRIGESLSANQSRILEHWLLWEDSKIQIPPMNPDALLRSLRDAKFHDREPPIPNSNDNGAQTGDERVFNRSKEPVWRDTHLPVFDLEHRYDGDRVALLSRLDESVLDLSPSQVGQLSALADDQHQRIIALRLRFDNWERRDAPERAEFIGLVRELYLETDDRLRFEVLGPNQRRELDRIHWRMLSRSRGPLGLIVDGSLGDELEISEEQVERILSDRMEIAKAVENQILNVHDDALEQLIAVLTPRQRQIVKAAMGKPPSLNMRGSITKLIPSLRSQRATDN